MTISKVIVGLEVHIELRTNSKMFCGCPADHFGKEPNTQTCPVCLGLPGALPVPNRKAIEQTIGMGLFLGGTISPATQFDRKNYFYPDLPKGYQISQYETPFIVGGQVILDSGKVIRLRRIHLEEDTAKLQHATVEDEKVTLIDFNRSGVPLIEIVSEPDAASADEAKEFLEKIRQAIRYLGYSDADMEKGSMRCEPNINLEIAGDDGQTFKTPIVEVKNINSFNFAKKAIDFETNRQYTDFLTNRIEIKKGNKVTRGWDEDSQATVPQRQKEEADDYRYFPEPDIPPFVWSQDDIVKFNASIAGIETPSDRRTRFIADYSLTDYQAKQLTQERKIADFFEQAVSIGSKKNITPVAIANTLINKKAPSNLSPDKLVDYLISTQAPKVDDNVISQAVRKLALSEPGIVASFKEGKPQALGAFVGQLKKDLGVIVTIDKISAILDSK